MSDLICFLPIFVTEIFCGSQISIFECVDLLAVTYEEMMWQTSLVELNIVLEVHVLFLFEQVLLSSLWNIIGKQGVTLMKLCLILSNSSSHMFL